MAIKKRIWRRLLSRVFHGDQRRARHGASDASAALSFELLEARRLLSIVPPYISPTNARLVIIGSDLADQVDVSELVPGMIHVAISGGGETLGSDFAKSQISSIFVNGNGGNDRITNTTDLNIVAYGGGGDDTLIGGSAADEMFGGDGNDIVYGGAGADSLRGEAGDDRLYGEGGNDVLLAGIGNDILNGGADDDDLFGHEGDDVLVGGSGDDRLVGEQGIDDLRGNDGDDRLIGGGEADVLQGGLGNDVLHGDAGDDDLVGNEGDDTIFGGDGNDQLNGNAGADILYGDAGNDSLVGGDGADRLYGEGGFDTLSGGNDNDIVFGGAQRDLVYGGAGDDQLRGDAGDDQLYGGTGSDTLLGGDGNDYLGGGEQDDSLFGDNGDDQLLGGTGNDILYGNAGIDQLRGDDGDDQIFGGDNDDAIYGGLGNDSLRGDDGNDSLVGDEGNDTLLGGAGNDDLQGGDDNDTIYGGMGSDQLLGAAGDDRLYGEQGDDLLVGEDGNDFLSGGDENDLLRGGLGDDVLYGNNGVDRLFGDAGADMLSGGDDDDTLTGGADDDILRGELGDDRLLGEAGNDRLYGDEGRDTLYGHDGDDQLYGGDEGDHLYGEAGDDILRGGTGDDYLAGGIGSDNLQGSGGNDQLYGGAGDDQLFGQLGNDRLVGEFGSDILYGDEGADYLYGGDGDDLLNGGVGNDELRGEAGNDDLRGADGNDYLLGGAGADQLLAGAGDDRLRGGDGNDELHGEAGNDFLLSDAGDDTLFGDEGDDRLYGHDGHDTLYGGLDDDILHGGLGDDTLRGDEGEDRLNGRQGNDTLVGGADNDIMIGGDDADVLRGQAGDDHLRGDEGDDLLYGDEGNDVLLGNTGNDQLFGGAGQDLLYGDVGDDLLRGDEGNDQLYGEAGNDSFQGGDGDDVLRGGVGNDYLLGGLDNDQLFGGSGADRIHGEQGDDTLHGEDGNDQLFGGDNQDVLFGGAGNDTLHGSGGDDQLHGEKGDDALFGGDGRDILSGGDHRDILYGEAGPDMLLGGTGEDELRAGDGNDLLVGGVGVDSLFGAAGDDLLIGGTTSHTLAVLDLALTAWSENPSYDARILMLENETFLARLQSEATVFDDYVPDTIHGGDGQDWFFLPGAMTIYDPTGNFVNEPGHEHNNGQSHSHLSVPVVSEVPAVEGFALIDSLDDIRDIQENESLHTLIPHARETGRHVEHLTLFELVKYADVTHAAVGSGDWSDSATWADGVIPGSGARVLIPIGISVTVDHVQTARLATVRVDGELSFATNVNTQLDIETMVVGSEGSLQIGTAAAPIASNVKAHLRFTSSGPIDRVADPFGIGRGLITHGSVEIHGTTVTSHVELLGPATAGTTQLALSSVPVGWKAGDQIVIAGTSDGADQDEARQILGIAGNVITVAALAFDHVAPSPELKIHVANLTRNVVIDSEASAATRRGHVMFMHHRDVDIQYAGFYQLGRTDKLTPLNDSVVDEAWQLAAGTGANNRARYPIHFHRNGAKKTGSPAVVHGSVVADAPGWGYVNHSSYVEFTDNVSYDITGAGFVTEVGDEVGLFQRNIAINTIGSGDEIDARRTISDFGHTGDGFWFQGAGIEVVDNISIGADHSAFTFYTEPLRTDGQVATYLASNLADPSIAGGAETIAIDHVPIDKFHGNTGYGSQDGLTIRNHMRDALHSQSSVIRDSTFWNNAIGVNMPYTEQVVLENLKIVRDADVLDSIGVTGNADTTDVVYKNLTISGYHVGIGVARRGYSVVDGGTFTTQRAIVVGTATRDNRQVVVQGPIVFNDSPLGVDWIYEIEMRFDSYYSSTGIDRIFRSHTVTLNYGSYINQKVYFRQQHPDHVVYPEPDYLIPAIYIGLTAQQIQDQYGQTIGGELAPIDSVTTERIDGLLDPN